MVLKEEDLRRFWAKVKIGNPDECWLWTAACRYRGYGKFSLLGSVVGAHRFALYTQGVEIPPGYCVCHKCDNPTCCNPSHLFVGTLSDNARDAVSKGRFNRNRISGRKRNILTETNVIQAKEMRREGMTYIDIANIYGVAKTTILSAINGITWKQLL